MKRMLDLMAVIALVWLLFHVIGAITNPEPATKTVEQRFREQCAASGGSYMYDPVYYEHRCIRHSR